MTEFKSNNCASVGMRMSLLFAALGVVAPFVLILAYLALIEMLFIQELSFQLGVIAGIVTLFLSAAFLGRIAGKIICHKWRGIAGATFVGVCLVISCIVLAIVAGASFWALVDRFLVQEPSVITSGNEFGFLDFMGTLLVLFLFFGGLPAILLGGLYGVLVRRRLAKVE